MFINLQSQTLCLRSWDWGDGSALELFSAVSGQLLESHTLSRIMGLVKYGHIIAQLRYGAPRKDSELFRLRFLLYWISRRGEVRRQSMCSLDVVFWHPNGAAKALGPGPKPQDLEFRA